MKKFFIIVLLLLLTTSRGVAWDRYPMGTLSDDVVSGYKDLAYSLWAKPHRDYALTINQEFVRAGNLSLRFEVRNGDCGFETTASMWSDCKNDRERHELTGGGKRDKMSGGEYWFAWSIYLPEDHINVTPYTPGWPQLAYGQFHQKGGSPVFMFKEKKQGYSLVRTIGDYDYHEVLIIPNEDFVGKWNDILVNAKWSKKDDGFFKLWVNGELKYNYKGKTKTEQYVYYKFGVYRTGVSHYKGPGKFNTSHWPDEFPNSVVYFDEVRKGKTKEEVTKGLK